MKTALITTTINVPTVLELYRQHGPDVAFFVAGDIKTPPEAAMGSDAPHFMDVAYQKSLGYKCSDLIGWNTIQRRNIALLEAVKWGADIIVSVDDDNIPFSNCTYSGQRNFDCRSDSYFAPFVRLLDSPSFYGFKVSSPTGWFDVGTLLDPVSPHRGFPHDVRSETVVSHVVGARVGLAAGLCLGDPDISSCTRISRAPVVHRVSELLNSGIVVDPSTRTVFNSQNTAFIRELAPAFFMLPGVGRYDDIYASLIMQRVMRERNLHVHFGKPFVWQQRNQHNLVKDLRGEIDGMENIKAFADFLDSIDFPKDPMWRPIDLLRILWEKCCAPKQWFPAQTLEAALAFLEDMEAIL